jgi:hypothetical protein
LRVGRDQIAKLSTLHTRVDWQRRKQSPVGSGKSDCDVGDAEEQARFEVFRRRLGVGLKLSEWIFNYKGERS